LKKAANILRLLGSKLFESDVEEWTTGHVPLRNTMADPIKNRRVLRRLSYVFGGFTALILLLAAIGATYEAIAESREVSDPPPGRLVDVAGHKMHLYCTGQGTPTVILESGLWNDSSVWYKVQPENY
jgi:hypothetical protein